MISKPKRAEREIPSAYVTPPPGKISTTAIDRLVRNRYHIYAAMTIEDRAVPDFRDGLIPVYRRILWTMNEMGLHHNHDFRKLSSVSGTVMGDYHPHGQIAIEDAVASLSQAHSKTPMVDGQGNWGDYNCFPADTLISTDIGLVPIQDLPNKYNIFSNSSKILLNTSVESLHNTEKTTVWLNCGSKPLLEIHTPFSSVKASYSEPFLVLDNDLNFIWKSADKLKISDRLCYHRDPHIVWPKGGAKLNCYWGNGKEKNIKVPNYMSIDFASWLGLIISEGGISKNSIQFCNSDPQLIEKYENLTNKLFPNVHFNTFWRDPKPGEWAKKRYCQVIINSTFLSRWLESNGIPPVSASNKTLPSCIMQSSKEEAIAFLSHIFEGDGYNTKSVSIGYTSISNRLLEQLRVFMLTKFGLPFRRDYDEIRSKNNRIALRGIIYYRKYLQEIGFVSHRKNVSHTKRINQYTTGHSEYCKYLKDYMKKLIKSNGPNELLDENNNIINSFTFIGSMLYNLPLLWHDWQIWFYSCKNELAWHFPTAFKKLSEIFNRNYLFAPVTKVIKMSKEVTYDLVVPNSQAFTANGIIVHNSNHGASRYIECRLTEYADKVLLDPYYLAVVPMVPNYDGRKKEPLFLPALLPNILLFGMEGGIAVGTTSMFPPFDKKGVLRLLQRAVRDRAISAELCARVLKMDNRWGGHIISDTADMVNFYQSGEGTIRFACDYSFDGSVIVITGVPPRWNYDNNLERLQEDDDILSVTDLSAKGNIKVVIKLRPEAAKKDETRQRIERMLQSYMAARTNVTMRYIIAGEIAEAGADFQATNIPTILRNWLRWRIALERRALGAHLARLREQIRRQTLLRKAVTHSDFIIDAVRNRRNTSDEMIENQLMTKLQITREEVKEILELRIRQLTHLSGRKIDETLNKLQQERMAGEQQLLQPVELVINKTTELLRVLK